MGEVASVVYTRPEAGPEKPAEQPKTDPNRPTWLPEKFKTPEDLAKSYSELEKKVGQTPAQKPVEPTADKKSDEVPTDPLKPVEKKPDTPSELTPEDLSKYSEAYTKNGNKLTDSEYAELKQKYNASKAVVDDYIRLKTAENQRTSDDVLSTVGGADGYTKLSEWAGANLDQASIDAFNKTLQTRDTAQIKLALKGLKSAYDEAQGTDPNLVGANATRTSGPAGFKSIAEQTAAVRDPRYKKDSAYRKDVEQRMSVSQF